MLSGINIGHPNCRALAEHWARIPKDGLVPRRTDLQPEAVPGLLPDMVMFDLVDRENIRIRLAGTAVVARYGFDPTGTNYLNYIGEGLRMQSAMALWAMAETPCGMWGESEQVYEGDSRIRSEAIGFPLLNSDGEPTILIFQQVAVQRPDILNTSEQELVDHRVLSRQFIDIGAGLPDFGGQSAGPA